MSSIKIACSQNVYVITDHMELLEHEKEFISNYDVLIIANNYDSQSVSVIDQFQKKHAGTLLLVLHCYTLAEAKRFHDRIARKVNYITYNEKMIYAVMHIALNIGNL